MKSLNHVVKLKLALLTVLFANLSWNSFLSQRSASVDLAQEVVATSRPAPTQVAAPARVDSQDGIKTIYTKVERICGLDFRIRMSELKSNSEDKVRVTALDLADPTLRFSIDVDGTWSSWERRRDDLVKTMDTHVRNSGRLSCNQDQIAGRDRMTDEDIKRRVGQRRADQTRDEQSRDEKKSLAETAKKRCDRMGSGKGRKYAKAQCHIDRLLKLETEFKTLKDEDERERAMRAEVRDIVSLVRPMIKEGLKTDDQDTYDSSVEMLDDLVDNLESMDVDGDYVVRQIKELRAMKVAGRLGYDSIEGGRKAKAASDRYDGASKSYVQTGDMYSWMAMQQAMFDLQRIANEIQATLRAPVMQNQQLVNNGQLSRSDFDLLVPYSALANMYKSNNQLAGMWQLPSSQALGWPSMDNNSNDPFGPRIYDPYNPTPQSMSDLDLFRARQNALQNGRNGSLPTAGPAPVFGPQSRNQSLYPTQTLPSNRSGFQMKSGW